MGIVERDFDCEELHPIDIVETLAEERSWDFDRIADDQIAMAIEGTWRTYSVTLAWSARDEIAAADLRLRAGAAGQAARRVLQGAWRSPTTTAGPAPSCSGPTRS